LATKAANWLNKYGSNSSTLSSLPFNDILNTVKAPLFFFDIFVLESRKRILKLWVLGFRPWEGWEFIWVSLS